MLGGRGKGYVGNRMSVNAHNAHMNNELPLSHWSKKKIMEVIEENEIETTSNFNKLTKEQLHDEFLDNSSWHHTGSFYNVTDFYTLDLDRIASITKEEVDELIKERQEYLEATREIRRKERERKEKERKARLDEKLRQEHIASFRKLTKYKTDRGLIKAVDEGRIKIEDLEVMKSKAIEKKKEELRVKWEKDKANAERLLKRLEDDETVYRYV